MAQLTIQDILGSDNVASSRATISSNFKILVDGINKIETFLNTSPNGGSLSIGTITINKFTRPISDILFVCEASATIAGNLSIGTVGQGTTITINSIPIFNYTATFKKDVTFDKLTAGNTISIKTKLSIEELLVVPVNIISKTSVTAGLVLEVEDVSSTVNLDWDTSIEDTLTIDDGVDGQILIVRNSGTYDPGATVTFKNADGTTIFTLTLATPAVFTNVKTILQFVVDPLGNHWEVLSIIGVEAFSDYTIA